MLYPTQTESYNIYFIMETLTHKVLIAANNTWWYLMIFRAKDPYEMEANESYLLDSPMIIMPALFSDDPSLTTVKDS